ncbi:membrane-bound O-acyltransferase gup1-like isoform X3 [Dioscorea cayenensis subsp. rotundata]|nr:membrane-bound O-acyltransferase gup1-like isoform X3 [Dioscorea cayenensis subsp. rotundata]
MAQAANQQHFQGSPVPSQSFGAAPPSSGNATTQAAAAPPRQRVRARRGQATDPHSIAERNTGRILALIRNPNSSESKKIQEVDKKRRITMMAMGFSWKLWELAFIVLYALAFYALVIYRSLQLSHDNSHKLFGLRPGWILGRLNDLSDPQWRNFRGNLPILMLVFGIFTLVANTIRRFYHLRARGMSLIWSFLSLCYLSYLHGACIVFILLISSMNFFLVKIFARTKYFVYMLWIFNIAILLLNRVYEGYSFTLFGANLAFLDSYRGTFRWHICFNLVILRMISFGLDYHWFSDQDSRFDQKERSVPIDKYSFNIYLSYLIYAPLYIAGPITSFNAFAMQLDIPQKNHSVGQIAWYGVRWAISLFLMEILTHFFYYNSYASSDIWKNLSPLEIFIIGYGVINFMWLKFSLIWRFFRFWSLIGGVETPENMPRCVNDCYDLESFWKSWHASFNKWLVRYMYIPLGGSQRKLLNVWVIFTFVALWHDLEWKLICWAWLTCIFLIPEIVIKSAAKTFQVRSALGGFIFRELSAISGAVTITCLMVANLAGYVIGPNGINWLISRLLQKDGLHVLCGIFTSFYIGTKLMFHIRDAKQKCW